MEWRSLTLGQLVAWLPLIISIAGAVALIAHSSWSKFRERVSLAQIMVFMIVGRVLYPVIVSALQWWVWSQSELGRILLARPLDSAVPLPWEGLRILFSGRGGYFAFYEGGRMWLPMILLFCAAGFFAGIFALLKRIRPRALPDGVARLAFVSVLIVGPFLFAYVYSRSVL